MKTINLKCLSMMKRFSLRRIINIFVVIIISVYEYYYGKELLFYFLIAGSVFFSGALIQVIASKSIFSRLESNDAEEENIFVRVASLRRTAVFGAFFRKYFVVFVDCDNIEREYKILQQDYSRLKVDAEGELIYKGIHFISFIENKSC